VNVHVRRGRIWTSVTLHHNRQGRKEGLSYVFITPFCRISGAEDMDESNIKEFFKEAVNRENKIFKVYKIFTENLCDKYYAR